MKATYFPYIPLGERPKVDKAVWNWHQSLAEQSRIALATPLPAGRLNIGAYAPIGAFHEPPLRKHLVQLDPEMILEIELPATDKMRTEVLDKIHAPVWIAEVVHMIGYYILAKWCGSPKNTGYFWVHGASAAVHQVGYTELAQTAKGSGRGDHTQAVLCPPFAIYTNQNGHEGWSTFVQQHVHGRMTVGDNFDKERLEAIIKPNKFHAGERVETIHDEESSVLAPAIVKRVLGRRILLEYSKMDIDKSELIEKENMWRDMNDDLIYPVGFAETMGLRMTANKKYQAHVAAIAQAIKNGDATVPYSRNDATKSKVYQWRPNANSCAEWEVEMVCEMIDRLDECQNVLKAARVLKVLPDGYLQIGPEGADILNDSFYVHMTSPILFPVGYARQYNIQLQGPKGDNEEAFDWDSFLKRTAYKCAPDHLFHEATPHDVPFEVGMRIEAIDQNEKMLCPATIKAIKGRLVLVTFDGWDEEFDQLYDFRSNELLPCGWGEAVGHALQAPAKPASHGKDENELQAEEVSDDDMEE